MEAIASGRTATLYRVGDGRAFKRYDGAMPREAVERERAAMALACAQGLPALTPGPLREHEGRWGFEMPLRIGVNGMDRIYAGAAIDGEARLLAQLQAQVHRCTATALRPHRRKLEETLAGVARLHDDERAAVRDVLDALPDGAALLHGDFHPGNLFFTADGPVILDWIDSGGGDPAADVARSLVLFGEGQPRPADERRFRDIYLETYRQASGADLSRLDDWVLVQQAARLAEAAERQPEALLAAVRATIYQKGGAHVSRSL